MCLLTLRTIKKLPALKIDIVICTYNRAVKLLELVNQLYQYAAQYNAILIIDSSDEINPSLSDYPQLVYLRSPYKNQPYQRWLGYSRSEADAIVFLDDDMEIANADFFTIIKDSFTDSQVVGVAINFKDKHADTALATIPGSVLFKKKGLLKKTVGWLSGYPVLPDGKLGLCGVRGRQPSTGGPTEWLSGGAFCARKTALFKNFNFQLFDLFQQRSGMGEDVIIGYGLSRQGVLLYQPQLLFYHNDQKDSSYSMDHFAYGKRVLFSRLYLSLEKTRLNKGNYTVAHLHYHWYAIWRLTGLAFNYMIKKNATQYKLLKGALEGYKLAGAFKFDKHGGSIQKWQ